MILVIAVSLVGFGVAGPWQPIGLLFLGLPLAGAMVLLLRPGLALILPLSGLLLIVPQIAPGFQLFDLATPLFILGTIVATVRASRHEAWDLRIPGAIALSAAVIPLLAVTNVVSFYSFLGYYKQILVQVAVFVGIRRLVSPRDSTMLLWIYPITGSFAAIELLQKTRGFGAKVYADLSGRNYFTSLGWGESNYVAALLVFCLCGSLLLAIVTRRTLVRVLLGVAGLLMMAAFLVLLSRAATIALGITVLILLLAWGGRRVIGAAMLTAVFVVALITTPGGQVILGRFVDPKEYASWYTRTLVWQYAWQRFLAHPWTGIGLNQGRYQADLLGPDEAHDVMLDFLMHEGILGGILVAVVIVSVYRLCLRARPVGWVGPTRPLRVALIAVTSAVFVNASVEPTLTGYAVGVLFVWFAAWLTLQDETASGRMPSAEGSPSRTA